MGRATGLQVQFQGISGHDVEQFRMAPAVVVSPDFMRALVFLWTLSLPIERLNVDAADRAGTRPTIFATLSSTREGSCACSSKR